jgi:hypothetical protein
MSDLLGNGNSRITPAAGETSQRWAQQIEKTKAFLRELFSEGCFLEESFSKICADGCPAEDFAVFFHLTLVLTASSIPGCCLR